MSDSIKSVSEYLEKLKKIKPSNESLLFYRGVAERKYAKPENNVPSVYRSTGTIKNEDKMFYELVSRIPEAFTDCQNVFDTLVKMQHYGLPTRLLDITSNPLVALYFACLKSENRKGNENIGEVIVFDIKEVDIRNYDSDRVSLISNLAVSPLTINYRLFCINEIRYKINKVLKCFPENKSDDSAYLSLLDFFISIKHLMKKIDIHCMDIDKIWKDLNAGLDDGNEVILSEIQPLLNEALYYVNQLRDKISLKNHPYKKDIENKFNELKGLEKYLGINKVNKYLPVDNNALRVTEILNNVLVKINYFSDEMIDFGRYVYRLAQDKIGFNPNLICAEDLITPQCVHPKHANPRIFAQSGYFLLVGFSENIKENKVDKPSLKDLYFKNIKITIKGKDKKKILEELLVLGISHATLFPEVESVAKELKEKYGK